MYGVTLAFGSQEVELSVPGEVRLVSAQSRATSLFTIYFARAALLRGEDGEPLFPTGSRCASGPLGETLARVHQSLVDGADERVIGALLEDVKRALAETPIASAGHGRRMEKQILGLKRAVSLLRADLKTNLSLEVLARESGLSPYHFARCFQRFTGLAPRPYRRLLRAHAARRLLEQGHSTTRAAAEVGFSDAPHLSRTFRAHFGTSPQTWARAWRATPR
jgi:AraC-like DNA-binding protein